MGFKIQTQPAKYKIGGKVLFRNVIFTISDILLENGSKTVYILQNNLEAYEYELKPKSI